MSDELRFDGQVALVTGAGGGLGRAYARLLAARGARVVVNDLGGSRNGEGADPTMAQGVVDEIRAGGGEAVANAASVTDPDGAASIVDQALAEWGRLDIVVNNAGISGGGTFGPPDVWELVVSTHLFGTVNVVRAAFPHLEAAGYGRIMNTVSSAFLGNPGAGAYASAKGGILGFTRVLASECRLRDGLDVKVNAVMPIAYSRMTAAMPNADLVGRFERDFQPEKVAAFVAVLCHESVPCHGETFIVGGGRAAKLVIATTEGYLDDDPTPESYLAHFDDVLAGRDQRNATSGTSDLLERLGIS